MFESLALAILLVLSALPAHGEETGAKSTIVVVKHAGEKFVFVEKKDVPGACRPQFGTPQLAPQFFEVTGEEGDVLYAASIGETRFVIGDTYDEDGKAKGVLLDRSDAKIELRIPRLDGARRFTIYRRQERADDGDERQVLLEVDL